MIEMNREDFPKDLVVTDLYIRSVSGPAQSKDFETGETLSYKSRQRGSIRIVMPDETVEFEHFMEFDRDVIGEISACWPDVKIHHPKPDTEGQIAGFGR